MKVLSVSLRNFASYPSLDFNFNTEGLSLIHGATGSGKSTLCDAIPWVLFGRTAKDGAVDEILRWDATESTYGSVSVQVKGSNILIYRERGGKSNDLMFMKDDTELRGKDIPDTQRLINQLLGITPELYLAGAYFHEFSQTAQFFTTTANNRRIICEQLVDLSLPKKLHLKTSETKKIADKELSKAREARKTASDSLAQLRRIARSEADKAHNWAKRQAERELDVTQKYDNFEVEKNQAIELYIEMDKAYREKQSKSPTCPTCGAERKIDHIHEVYSPFTAKIEATRERQNNYLEVLESIQAETNPHDAAYEEYQDGIEQLVTDLDGLIAEHDSLIIKVNDLELLASAISSYRAHLIDGTIAMVQTEVNELLSSHFDAEIRVEFETKAADKIEVNITKDGNLCAYTQLSKGQRQILKLCFAVAVMKTIALRHSVQFSQVFFDEALDGLDDNMKLKALDLLRALAIQYDQVFVVEHNSEIKASIESQYHVTLVNGASQIEKS